MGYRRYDTATPDATERAAPHRQPPLARATETGGQTGRTALPNDPDRQHGASIDLARPTIGVSLTLPEQDPMVGHEIPQAGAGRGHIAPNIMIPVQGGTPMPDPRRIERRLPAGTRDANEVIRGTQ